MKLFSPRTEAGYPDNCITVDNAIDGMRRIFADPAHRVTSFEVRCITDKGNTLRLAFDRLKVGQALSIEAER